MSMRTRSEVHKPVVRDHEINDIERDLEENLLAESELLRQVEVQFNRTFAEIQKARRERAQLLNRANAILRDDLEDWYEQIYSKHPNLSRRVHRFVRERVSPQEDIDAVFRHSVREREVPKSKTITRKIDGAKENHPEIKKPNTSTRKNGGTKENHPEKRIPEGPTCEVLQFTAFQPTDACKEIVTRMHQLKTQKERSYIRLYVQEFLSEEFLSEEEDTND